MNGWRRLLKFAPFMAVFLFLAGCGERRLTALDPMGPQAQWIYDNMILSLYVMAIVIIVVFVLFFIVVVRFRHKEGDNEYPEQVHGSTKLEVAWTVIPLFLLAILAVPTVTGQFYLSNTGLEDAEAEEDVDEEELDEEEVEELEDDVLQITATGHQFWWQFDYNHGEGFTAGNEVYIPVGQKVAFILEAEDVMHSFWVPALAGKVDNIPGIENYMWLEADEPGVYQGKCAELCGPSHALMDFRLIALEEDEYEQWATAMQEEEEAPTDTLADQGREVFEEQGCINCHAVDGQGSAQGPALTNFGDRETIANYLEVTDENLREWILDPQSIKQGNEMPAYEGLVSDDELDAIVAYLNQLEKLDPETKEGLERD